MKVGLVYFFHTRTITEVSWDYVEWVSAQNGFTIRETGYSIYEQAAEIRYEGETSIGEATGHNPLPIETQNPEITAIQKEDAEALMTQVIHKLEIFYPSYPQKIWLAAIDERWRQSNQDTPRPQLELHLHRLLDTRVPIHR